jgi:hypothetical protein
MCAAATLRPRSTRSSSTLPWTRCCRRCTSRPSSACSPAATVRAAWSLPQPPRVNAPTTAQPTRSCVWAWAWWRSCCPRRTRWPSRPTTAAWRRFWARRPRPPTGRTPCRSASFRTTPRAPSSWWTSTCRSPAAAVPYPPARTPSPALTHGRAAGPRWRRAGAAALAVRPAAPFARRASRPRRLGALRR